MQCQVQLRWRRLQILFVPSCISVHHVRHGVEKTNQSLSLMHIDRDWRNGQQHIKCTLSSFLNTHRMLTWGPSFHIRCNIKVMEKANKKWNFAFKSNISSERTSRLASNTLYTRISSKTSYCFPFKVYSNLLKLIETISKLTNHTIYEIM